MAGENGTRCVAIVGPYLSGKTSLMESLLSVSGGVHRKGSVKEGNTVGDSAPEARARHMSTEISVGATRYLDDGWVFLDCPGSIEMRQEAINALMVCDLAVVVYEPSTERAMTLAPIFKLLSDRKIPHVVFLNKIDTISEPVPAVYQALREVEIAPLVLRQIPIREGEDVAGYVDLVSGRAYRYTAGEGSAVIDIPAELADDYELARGEMEALADFDDSLLERLLEDEIPEVEEVYGFLTEGVRAANVVLGHDRIGRAGFRHQAAAQGAAPRGAGLRRRAGAARIGDTGGTLAQVFKTYHAQHAGKISLARVFAGSVTEGMTLNGQRVGSLLSLMGAHQTKLDAAGPGQVAALGRMDAVGTGDLLTDGGRRGREAAWPAPLAPVYALAISPENRNDEVKLTGALQRLNEEDPSISYEQNADTREMVLHGQGEIHLQVALEKLKSRYNVSATSTRPLVSPTRKPSARRSPSTAGSSARPAGTACSATSMSTSRPSRAARASSSPTRSSAARSPSSSSPPSRRA